MLFKLGVAAALAVCVGGQNTATGTAAVAAAAATAKTESPTSHVPGKAFDRIAIIWLENTDYTMAVGDRKPFKGNHIYLPSTNCTIQPIWLT